MKAGKKSCDSSRVSAMLGGDMFFVRFEYVAKKCQQAEGEYYVGFEKRACSLLLLKPATGSLFKE